MPADRLPAAQLAAEAWDAVEPGPDRGGLGGPDRDTPKAVNAFLAARDMTGRMEFLIGSKAQLAPVWKAYGIEVESTPEQREVGHTGLVYGIIASGKRRGLYPANLQPSWRFAHDVPILAAS